MNINIKLEKSLAMQEKAKNLIPGMTQLLSKRPDQFSMGVWPGYYSKAKGVEVWDLDGNRYVDMSISGIGANVLGYADPDVDAAVVEAIRNGSSCTLNCPEEVELAELLCELHPWAGMVRYARTGGESMAIAVRIARAHTGKDKIAFCGYHGWHDWYLSANVRKENSPGEHLLPGLNPCGVPRALAGTSYPFRYDHLEELEKIVKEHGKDLGVIVMEAVRKAEKPADGFLDGVRALADKTGAVLVVDEISAGFRMNTGGAHLLLGLKPDIAVFSKAIGNGYPIAAVIGKTDIMQSAQKTFISSTCWTERTGPAAAIATIRKHKAVDAGKHLMSIGQKVRDGWKECAGRHGLDIEIAGMYPMSHFTFKHEKYLSLKALLVQWMLERGFLASTLFYAMYAHKEEHVSLYLDAVDQVFAKISDAIRNNRIDEQLVGLPSGTGFKRLT